MLNNLITKTTNLLQKYAFLILIALFVYIAIAITRLNSSLEATNKSLYNLVHSSTYSQNQPETVSLSEMMNQVNFRHEFDNIWNKLDEMSDKLDIVEINTRH